MFIQMAKNEILKIDDDHDGKSDALEALDSLQAHINAVLKYVDRLNDDDITCVLVMLPQPVAIKYSPQERRECARELAQTPKDLHKLSDALARIEKSLTSR